MCVDTQRTGNRLREPVFTLPIWVPSLCHFSSMVSCSLSSQPHWSAPTKLVLWSSNVSQAAFWQIAIKISYARHSLNTPLVKFSIEITCGRSWCSVLREHWCFVSILLGCRMALVDLCEPWVACRVSKLETIHGLLCLNVSLFLNATNFYWVLGIKLESEATRTKQTLALVPAKSSRGDT